MGICARNDTEPRVAAHAPGAAVLAGCRIPYPVFVGAGGAVEPPGPRGAPLSAAGARVVAATDAPACALLGLATGVGGQVSLASPYVPSTPDPVHDTQAAHTALRNAVAAAGGTHFVVDGTEVYTTPEGNVDYVVVRARAFRCGGVLPDPR